MSVDPRAISADASTLLSTSMADADGKTEVTLHGTQMLMQCQVFSGGPGGTVQRLPPAEVSLAASKRLESYVLPRPARALQSRALAGISCSVSIAKACRSTHLVPIS